MSNIQKFAQPVRVGNFGSTPSDASSGSIYWDTGTNALYVANGSTYAQLATAANEFLTNVFRLDDNSDPTKKIAFDATAITTGTTRTLKMANANVDLANLTNSNISASAAIAYSKLNLSASIVNADIATAAAIAVNKLAALTANRAVASDSSGFLVASATTDTELGYLSGVTSPIQSQINAISTGLSWKNAVLVATTANITLSGEQTIDGFLTSSSRVLVKNQTTQANNGIYVSAAGAWTRASDMNTWAQIPAAALFVQEGTVNGDVAFVCTSQPGGTLGSTAVTFVQFSAAGSYIAGNGISISGTTISANVDNSTIDFTGSQLEVKTGGITNTQINASAAIAYSKLNLSGSIVNADINTSAAIVYSKLSLSNSIVNADINSAAAIAYSKLALSNSIINADINSTAAIAYSKLAALTTSRALQSNSSTGFIEVSAVTNTELGYVSGVTSAIQTQLNTKLSSVSQDTAPTLGGDLTLNSKVFIGVERRGASNAASVQQEYLEFSLTQSTTAVASSLTFDSRNFKGVSIEYTISNGNDRRKGRLELACNNATGADSTVISLTDQSTETADILVSWSAAMNSHNVELSYTTGSGTFNMDADIKRFRS